MINFPEQIDNDENLYLVHDKLRLSLLDDYNPGDSIVYVEENDDIFSKFPSIGVITLTEQCSDTEKRAINLTYTGKGDFSFTGCEIMDGFIDSFKAKRITNVTQNVIAEHHETIKDALIAIQTFAGVKDEVATTPLDGTMEERINYLRNLVLKPSAWFSVNAKVGVVPLCLTFTDLSSRTPDTWEWDFGDSTSISLSRSNLISSGTVSKCYYDPGLYTVSLKVTNEFGENEIAVQDVITARVEAPNLATIDFLPSSDQILSGGVLRTLVNQYVNLEVTDNGENPLDLIVRYIWNLGDDLSHDQTDIAVASYSIGGYYDIELKTETTLGAYRITKEENKIDVVENTSLWHFIFDPDSSDSAITKNLFNYEFSLIGEFYKNAGPAVTSVTRDYSFLGGKPSYDRQFKEFRRNNGLAPMSTTTSGSRGLAMGFYSMGASSDLDTQYVKFFTFNGFDGIIASPSIDGSGDTIERYWNFVPLISLTTIHLLFGLQGPYPQPTGSPTNLNKTFVYLNTLTTASDSFEPGNLLNGATDLAYNPDDGLYGDFSVYRSTWLGNNGYIVRNDGGGSFFRLKSFYQSQPLTLGDEVYNITKLTDMPGSVKVEGQLVSLGSGIYFFNNTGEVLVYDPVGNIWGTGGPGLGAPSFTELSDKTVPGYDDASNTLIAVSDGDRRAYLFFDYSTDANITFNDIDRTFRKLPERPVGEQFGGLIY